MVIYSSTCFSSMQWMKRPNDSNSTSETCGVGSLFALATMFSHERGKCEHQNGRFNYRIKMGVFISKNCSSLQLEFYHRFWWKYQNSKVDFSSSLVVLDMFLSVANSFIEADTFYNSKSQSNKIHENRHFFFFSDRFKMKTK